MRRDTEIGIIVGVVLAIIIGVFISTRTEVKEPTIPLSHMYEGRSAENELTDLGVLAQQQLPEGAVSIEEKPKTIPTAPKQPTVHKEARLPSVGQEGKDEIVEDEFQEEDEEEELVEGEWEEIEQPATVVVEKTKPAPIEVKEPETVIHTGKDITYKVKPNDTLAKLAKQYYGDEGKWRLIYDANVGKIARRDALYAGQEIVIPSSSAPVEKPTVVEYLPSPPTQVPAHPKEVGKRTHTIQKGDTLIKLARQYYNSEAEWKKIYDANKNVISNPNALSQGAVLIIPE